MSVDVAPVPRRVPSKYRLARLVSLLLSLIFALVALAMNIIASLKGSEQKRTLQSHTPLGTKLTIDTSDVLAAGTAVSIFSSALGIFSLLSLVAVHNELPSNVNLASLEQKRTARQLSTRKLSLPLPLQAALLALATVGLFGALVAMTDSVAGGQAKVSAKVLGVPVLPGIVHAFGSATGQSSEYKEMWYLRLAVIFPWIAFLFGAMSSGLTLLAALRATKPGLRGGGAYQLIPVIYD